MKESGGRVIRFARITTGTFRRFRYLKEDGQIFPLLVIILILMLVAVMAFINTSQVNLRKISTMNAADAAAMAGASQLATAANQIADTNANILLPAYLIEAAALAIPKDINTDGVSTVIGVFTEFMVSSAFNLLTYMQLLVVGFKSVQQAGGSAVYMAFQNIPTEEATRRKVSAVGGNLSEPLLSQYLENIDVYDSQTTLEVPYEWSGYRFNVTTGQQEQAPGEKITIKVNKPPENYLELVPAPPMPMVAIFTWGLIPCRGTYPCGYGCYWWDCSQCWLRANTEIIPAHAMMVTMSNIVRVELLAVLETQVIIDLFNQYYVSGALATIEGIAAYIAGLPKCIYVTPKVPTPIVFNAPPWVDCSALAYMYDYCYFLYPLPFIAYIANNEADVTVEARRFSPTKDLGLYRFKEQDIKSRARAGMYGGNVFSPGSYKIQVHEAN